MGNTESKTNWNWKKMQKIPINGHIGVLMPILDRIVRLYVNSIRASTFAAIKSTRMIST